MKTRFLGCSITMLMLLPFFLLSNPAFAQRDFTRVRVRLFESQEPRAVTIYAANGSVVLFAGESENPIAQIREDEATTISLGNNQLYFTVGEMGIYAETIRLEPIVGAQLLISIFEGASTTNPEIYEGHLEIDTMPSSGSLKIVNEINLEDYVAAVLSSEYDFNNREGAKAMAVLIRSHTVRLLNAIGPGYDFVDREEAQWYRGAGNITHEVLEAVRQTSGLVLTHEGTLIPALYYSRGSLASDINFSSNTPAPPYVRTGVESSGVSATTGEWESRVSRPRLLARLSDAYGFTVEGFHIGQRGPDERVMTIELLKYETERIVISAGDFRRLILRNFGQQALRSTLFTARRRGDEYVFTGRGTEQEFGLNPADALRLSQEGRTFEEILNFYYTGVSLIEMDELTLSEPAPELDPTRPSRRGRIGW